MSDPDASDPRLDRRAVLRALAAMGGVGVFGATTSACMRAAGTEGVLRVGFLANLTHAPVIVGVASGRIGTALAGTKIEVRTFRAGPRVAEALLGRAIDVGVLGPLPIVSTHARHPSANVILSGCASGGASLVAQPWVDGPSALVGKRVATPQIGSTQDVSLRKWLASQGLAPKERGGTVAIDALASADIFQQMKRGAIAAAWLPEPWATRVVRELPGRRLIDERDLWPARRFPTAIVVARREFLVARRREIDAFTLAVRAEVARAAREPESTKNVVNAELKRFTTKALPRPTLDEAWTRVDFGEDPMRETLAVMANDARAVGYLPEVDCAGLFVV
jgi:NitT/TauT family transport system substrate-binding protein